MARNFGNRAVGAVIDFKFRTQGLSGAPMTLFGTPVVSVYKDNETSFASAALTVDFDGRTGMNHVRVDTSANPGFYVAGSAYQVMITAGTSDGTSVVGEPLADFTLGLVEDVNVALWLREVPGGLETGHDVKNIILDASLAEHIENGSVGAGIAQAASASGLDAAGVRNALGMGSANLDTQLASKPSTSAFEARTIPSHGYATVEDVVGVGDAVAALNNLSSEQAQAAAIAALNAYDPPTAEEMNGRTLPSEEYATADGIDAAIDAVEELNNISSSDVEAATASALGAYGAATGDQVGAVGDQVGLVLAVTGVLSSMIEEPSTGVYRFNTVALELARAGGGGGDTDWTSNERAAIRAILGIPSTGSSPIQPTGGVLESLSARIPAALSNGRMASDSQEINSAPVVGDGTPGNPWRGQGA